MEQPRRTRRDLLCLLLGCLILLSGCAEDSSPDKAEAVNSWNETAAVYNELAEEANRSGWSGDDLLFASLEEARAQLADCQAQILSAATEGELADILIRLEQLSGSLSACRETMLLPYDSAERQLYRSAVAAREEYLSLSALIRQNGWDHDADTLALMDSAAQTLCEAAEVLADDTPPDAETAAPLIAALNAFSAQAEARRSTFSTVWQPPDGGAVLH